MAESEARKIGRSDWYEVYEPSAVTLEEYWRLRDEGDREVQTITPKGRR